jgi:hypothetical protein
MKDGICVAQAALRGLQLRYWRQNVLQRIMRTIIIRMNLLPAHDWKHGTRVPGVPVTPLVWMDKNRQCDRDNQSMDTFNIIKQHRAMAVRSGLLCLFLFSGHSSAAETSAWSQVAEEIAAHINLAESLYQEGKPKEAGHAVTQAYFGVFEDRKMEAAMRIELGASHTYQVEQQFGALRKAIRAQADERTVQGLAQGIRESVTRDARALDQANIPMEVFEVNK